MPAHARLGRDGTPTDGARLAGCPYCLQASRLKYLAEAFRIPVLVTNQVTTQWGEAAAFGSGGGGGGGSEGHLTAALGTLWAHAVNTRLVLESLAGGQGGVGGRGCFAGRSCCCRRCRHRRCDFPSAAGHSLTDHATLLYPESFCWPPPAGTRFLKVAKSPAAPPTAFAYAVTEGGLEELPGVEPPPPQQHQHQQHQQQQQRGGVLGMHIANEMDYEAPPPLQRL